MKNYIIEFIGTFFLVLAIGLTGNPLAIGVMLMVMVYMGGHISGAHYNPAVSIAMIFRGLLSVKEAINYILSQLAGAFLAAIFVQWVGGSIMEVGPSNTASVLQILSVEAIFTFALVLVILNVATNPKTEGNSYYGLAIGFTVMAGAFDAIIGDGNTLSNLWYYLVGPIVGAMVAAYVYKLTTD